jgi:hypothetical protein
MSKWNGTTERHKTIPYDKIYHSGKQSFVCLGLDPFRDMSKRNGTTERRKAVPYDKIAILVNRPSYGWGLTPSVTCPNGTAQDRSLR